MRELLLYDPKRRPADWNEHLADGECAVFLSDVRSDAQVTADGSPKPLTTPSVCLVFDSREVATAWCTQRVSEIEHLRCELYDRRGMAPGPMATFVNPKYASRVPNRRRAKWMVIAAIACFPASVPLFWWDWRYYRGGMVAPTFVGITLLVTGVRLLFFAWAEFRLAAEHERKQAAAGQ